jgi:hypothetical protein
MIGSVHSIQQILLQATTLELEATSYEVRAMSYELQVLSYEIWDNELQFKDMRYKIASAPADDNTVLQDCTVV